MTAENIRKLSGIPAIIRQNGLFCCWKYEARSNGKQAKVPYSPRTGRRAAGTSHYGTFSEAAAMAVTDPSVEGIGLGIFDGICGIDIDHCMKEDGHLSSLAQEVIRIMDSYTEVSPSGTGVHIYFWADPETLGVTREEFQKRFYMKATRLGLEVYLSGMTYRYLTITGDAIHYIPDDHMERTKQVMRILDSYMKRPSSDSCTNQENGIVSLPANLLSDAELIEKAKSNQRTGEEFTRLWAGDWKGCYPSQSEADYSLMRMLAFWTAKNKSRMDHLFRMSGLNREKYTRREGYRNSLIETCIRSVQSVYTGGNSHDKGYALSWDSYIN